MVSALSPMLSPVLGSWLMENYSTKGLLFFIFLFVGLSLVVYYQYFKETHILHDGDFIPKKVVIGYVELLLDKYFLSRLLAQVLIYITMTLTISLSPFVLQGQLDIPVSRYGLMMLVPTLGIFIGGGIRRLFPDNTLLTYIALIIWALAGVFLICSPLTILNYLISVFFQMLSYGIIYPVIISDLMMPYKKSSGAVSALAGALQFALAGGIGGILTWYFIVDAYSLGVAYLISAILMFIILFSWRNLEFGLTAK